MEDPKSWYKHVRRVQIIKNSTKSRSTQYSPFKLLTGVEMRSPYYPDMRNIIEAEEIESWLNDQDEMRAEARANIANWRIVRLLMKAERLRRSTS